MHNDMSAPVLLSRNFASYIACCGQSDGQHTLGCPLVLQPGYQPTALGGGALKLMSIAAKHQQLVGRGLRKFEVGAKTFSDLLRALGLSVPVGNRAGIMKVDGGTISFLQKQYSGRQWPWCQQRQGQQQQPQQHQQQQQ